MDDASGGARGLRAEPSPELVDLLRAHYGLEGEDARDLGGSANLNLRVAGNDGDFVVRVYRSHIGAARLGEMQRVRRFLVEAKIPCALPLSTFDGDFWTEFDGRLVEVERFVSYDGCMNSWARLEAGLPWLGRLHSRLRGFSVSPEGRAPLFSNFVASGDARDWTRRGAARIRAWGPSPAERQLAEDAEELAARVAEGERQFSFPSQLVHGDFWDNNVAFQAGRLALIADFDFMGERPRLDDLALTLFFAALTFDAAPPSRFRRLLDAYDSGCDAPLTSSERAALPWAMARQPLWGVGRWLALLDDESEARTLAVVLPPEVKWALQVTREIDRWQQAFA